MNTLVRLKWRHKSMFKRRESWFSRIGMASLTTSTSSSSSSSSSSTSVLRCALFFLNCLALVAAAIVVFLVCTEPRWAAGLADISDANKLLDDILVLGKNNAAHILVATLLCFGALLGLGASLWWEKCSLLTWLQAWLLLSVLIECALAVTCFAQSRHSNFAAMTLPKRLEQALIRHDNFAQEWDAVQMAQNCCGVHNASDWHSEMSESRSSSTLLLSLPPSCCPWSSQSQSESPLMLNLVGCTEKHARLHGCLEPLRLQLRARTLRLAVIAVMAASLHLVTAAITLRIVARLRNQRQK